MPLAGCPGRLTSTSGGRTILNRGDGDATDWWIGTLESHKPDSASTYLASTARNSSVSGISFSASPAVSRSSFGNVSRSPYQISNGRLISTVITIVRISISGTSTPIGDVVETSHASNA